MKSDVPAPRVLGAMQDRIQRQSAGLVWNIAPTTMPFALRPKVAQGHSHIHESSFLLRGHYGFSGSLQPAMIVEPGSGRPPDTGA
jgi:hypothetical protein